MKDLKLKSVLHLKTKYGLSDYMANKWVDKYYSVVRDELERCNKLSQTYQVDIDIHPFSLDRVKSKLRFTYNKQLINLHDELDFIKVMSTGNNLKGLYTMVTTKIPLALILTSKDPEETFEYWYEDFTTELAELDYDAVTVDEKSLTNYIKSTKAMPSYTGNKKLRQYVEKALSLIHTQQAVGMVPQIKNISAFGRMYYKGLNLQNVPSVVREAALGKCTKIDVNNAVFQFRFNYVREVQPDFKMSYTIEYTEHKKKLREQIALAVFDTNKLTLNKKVSIIKTAITAIGFGAKTNDASHWGAPALRDVFTPAGSTTVNTTQLKLFLDHPFIKNFVQEQKLMSDIIFKHVKKDFKALPDVLPLVSSKRGIAKSKVLAYLYQHYESEVMQGVYDLLGTKVLLKIHDGFYARDIMIEDKANIIQHFRTHNLTVEIESIKRYANTTLSAVNMPHEEFKIWEAEQAEGYVNRWTTETKTPSFTLPTKRDDVFVNPSPFYNKDDDPFFDQDE